MPERDGGEHRPSSGESASIRSRMGRASGRLMISEVVVAERGKRRAVQLDLAGGDLCAWYQSG